MSIKPQQNKSGRPSTGRPAAIVSPHPTPAAAGSRRADARDGDFLTAHAAEYTDEANKLQAALSDFPDALAQYNNLLPYYESIRDRLYPIMHTLRNYRQDMY